MRLQAESNGINVFGILFIIRTLVDAGIISGKAATEKLKLLRAINPRLPANDMERMMAEFSEI